MELGEEYPKIQAVWRVHSEVAVTGHYVSLGTLGDRSGRSAGLIRAEKVCRQRREWRVKEGLGLEHVYTPQGAE